MEQTNDRCRIFQDLSAEYLQNTEPDSAEELELLEKLFEKYGLILGHPENEKQPSIVLGGVTFLITNL